MIIVWTEYGVVPLVPQGFSVRVYLALPLRQAVVRVGCTNGRLGSTDWVEVMVV